ncbi:hypothetical protein [Planctomycetes bacterium TBK1r]|uniref:Transposase n=1 Tax=Stieleria magnilauensis TaxID=2527963 RepID=A0ABX5XYR4_9BACT|nr:hypothetical protein TBK1r_62070 [Planctomycetes bacterium TBK1r]
MSKKKITRWAGSVHEFKSPVRFALACEGIRNEKALKAAGWESLTEYVDANAYLLEQGRRELPYGLDPAAPDVPSKRPAAWSSELRNPSDHGDAKHAGVKEQMKNLEKELDRLQRQREQARGRERIEIEAKMRPLQKELDGMKFRTRHWEQPRATVGGEQ